MSEVAIPEDARPLRRGAAGNVALAERAYSQLKQAIGNLVLQPGKPLTERHISEWLGIGRMPVREALMRLRDEGLVGVVPRRGYFVSAISAEDAREIYEMLEGLEGMAVKLAADRATAEDVARLNRCVREQEDALARDDLDAWVIADERFHDAIIEIARNRRIQKVIEPLNMQLHRLRLFTVRLRPKPTRSVEDHRALVDAIQAGESDRARDIHQAHRAHARGVMIAVIQKYSGLSGGW
ncbi:MAG TPA: GntR family transcriptional regulator [Geminicoccaceae bacterium]|nr:GntR family transcriptional regulator [Geminicoccus sp.]HMU49448.1 GntR family transcriptional regulator [Geminicoccaceae bacterium]